MRTAQLTAWQPPAVLYAIRSGPSHSQTLKPPNLSYPFSPWKTINLSLKNTSSSSSSMPLLKSRRSSSIVCLSNSNSAADSEGSPWKAFGKALGNVTGGRSIEDVLKQQMQKKEFYPERGGSGEGPPRGGGGDGGSDGSDGTEGESFWDELLQVFLATIGLISLYIYLIKGDELIRLAKDYRIYITTGEESDRLKRIRRKWRKIQACFNPVRVEQDPFWLEKLIMSTKTQYDSPEKYQQIVEDYKRSMPPGWKPKRKLNLFMEDGDDNDDDNYNDNDNDGDDNDNDDDDDNDGDDNDF